MISIRKPAVAGQFYPASPALLTEAIEACLADARGPAACTPTPLQFSAVPAFHPDTIGHSPGAGAGEGGRVGQPRALIVPHAGYIYSGAVAASAYCCLRDCAADIHRVILLGPAHRVYFEGIAAPTVAGFETPLGVVEVDQAAIHGLSGLPGVVISDESHREEHSIEVQVPFMQMLLPEFTLVPLVVGDVGPEAVLALLEHFQDDPRTLIVVSSDLSHYLSYRQACQVDEHTSQAIVRLLPDAIEDRMACGSIPIRGLLQFARKKGWRVELLDYRNSGDTAGSRERVVGYGAYLFH